MEYDEVHNEIMVALANAGGREPPLEGNLLKKSFADVLRWFDLEELTEEEVVSILEESFPLDFESVDYTAFSTLNSLIVWVSRSSKYAN